jgi:hypothetical protein
MKMGWEEATFKQRWPDGTNLGGVESSSGRTCDRVYA